MNNKHKSSLDTLKTKYSILVTDIENDDIKTDFIFNHLSDKIKVKISKDDYKKSHRTDVRWDFGDGTILEAPEAIHSYSSPGVYNISATLYSTDGKVLDNIVEKYTIIVKEIVPTELTFTFNDNSWNNKTGLYVSKNNKLGEMQISISNNIIGEPKVSAIRRWTSDQKENSYFDIRNKSYYHLEQYYTFLEENFISSIDRSTLTNGILKPVEYYTPEYITLYGCVKRKDNSALIDAYILKGNNSSKQINFKPYKTQNGERDDKFNIKIVESLKELPSECTEIGKIGFFNVWYKNDFVSKNDLIFEIKKDSFHFSYDLDYKETYLNIPNLGFSFNTKEIDINNISNTNIFKALTSNGLYNILYNENNTKIETHLKHNFYKDYMVEGIYSYFIENDTLDDSISYNMYKNYIPGDNLSLYSDEDECLISISSNLKNVYNYYKVYNFTPKKSYFEIKDGNQLIYKHDKLINLNEIILPTEKITSENLNDVLDVYMQHPMYNHTSNLKTFLKDILGQNNKFQYIINKGVNFVDDQINIKSCYVDKLLSTFSMLGEDITRYDIDSFSKINDLKELLRILSMNYSVLFGTVINDEYDIKITPGSVGKNISDKIEVSDTIYCDKEYNIIALRRGEKILRLQEKTPFIVIKDDFTYKTHLGSFFNIFSDETDIFDDQPSEWLDNNKDLINNIKHTFKISDYNYKWGWSLNLPNEIEYKNNKENFIDAYYTFYLFNPVKSQKRKYNFLEESTIPTDNNGKQISIEDWNKDFGFTYDCLMKTLISYLMKP